MFSESIGMDRCRDSGITFLPAVISCFMKAHGNRLRLCLYSDGITPGTALACRNDRRIKALHWSWLEWAAQELQCEKAWCTFAAVRKSTVDKMPGGMSELFQHAIALLFGAPKHDLRNGIAIDFGELGIELLHATVGLVIQDGKAHQETLNWKGPSAHKMCYHRVKVVSHWSAWLRHSD